MNSPAAATAANPAATAPAPAANQPTEGESDEWRARSHL